MTAASPRQHQKISIIVPTYREAENIPELLHRIKRSMNSNSYEFEIIIVDDDSQDGIDRVVAELNRKALPARLIVRKNERGLSSAVLRGFEEALDADFLVCMDADLSHPPEAIPTMIEIFKDRPNTDMVLGSRYVQGGSTDAAWTAYRWVNSKIATLFARPFTRIKDPMAGFFAIPAESFRKADTLNPIGYKIALELIVKCPCKRVVEIPIHFTERQKGESKLCLKEQINYLRHIKRLADYKFGSISRFAQFCLVGSTGMIVDLTCYTLMLSMFVPIALARAVAIWIAMSWNFLLNRRITFGFRTKESILGQYWRFILTCAFGAAISWSISVGLGKYTTWFNKHLLIAAVLGIVAGTSSNFLMSSQWVFRAKRRKHA